MRDVDGMVRDVDGMVCVDMLHYIAIFVFGNTVLES